MPPSYALVERPRHVAPGLVVDFDYFHPSEGDEDVYTALKRLHDGPDLAWTPRNGGHWIATRAADIRWIRDTHAFFSHEEMAIPRGAMSGRMPPINVDPPRHARYRAVLNPSFTPARIRSLHGRVRAIAVELVERLAPRGHCEFVSEFAQVMPVLAFLDMADIRSGKRTDYVAWSMAYTSASDQKTKDDAAAKIAAFIGGVLDERTRRPGDDLFSHIAAWRGNPRFEDEADVLGMAMVSFIGGIDTVANMIAFVARHLASHPEARERLLREPGLIPQAAEEYLRRHGLTMTARLLKQDVTYKGADMRAGDMLLMIDALAGLDERVHAEPMAIAFDRNVRQHDTFGNGAHRCVGEHLARMEVALFIEEWLARIPAFRLDPAVPVQTHGGPVIGMSQLGLRWD